jgi:hypothetical protein
LHLELPRLPGAAAVWTDNEEFFHICWNSISMLPHPMGYIITDNNSSVTLNYTLHTEEVSSYSANLTRPPTKDDNVVQIFTVSQTALPSLPFKIRISGK